MTISLEAFKKLSEPNKANYLLTRFDREVNIYSGQHGAYWRSNCMGYSTSIAEAGVYTFADAIANTIHCGPEKQIKFHFVSDEPELPPVKSWEGDEVFDDVKLRFDKYHGVARSDSARRT